ncbi:hypothetical protein ABH935_007669 [Catenulispora sp. GAS73]|uniref:hypothetical protein n=1 Tax=Catenulispora sp. GAS73 TaxID=3156269 RepID=UPI003514CF6E
MKATAKKLPKAADAADPEAAFSTAQGDELLVALAYVGSYIRARGRRLVVFFGPVLAENLIRAGQMGCAEGGGLPVGS